MVFFATVLLLCYLCEAEFSDVSQPVSVQTLKIGESVTIECFIKSIINNRVWYKLTADRRLQVIATYSSRYNWSVVSVDELKHRYSVNSNGNNNHLTISAASWDDAGTYFCGVLRLTDIQFGSGTLLMLKGVKLNQSDVQPPVGSEDAVPFSCTFHAAQCTAEDTGVMWLKTSQRSAPEVIHVSGKTDDSCRRTERGEMTCEHKLFIRDVDSDGGGTYYCAATVCGQTQFGNVTMVFNSSLNPTVVVLVTSNIIFGIMTLLLFWMLCKSQRKASARAPKRSFVDQTAESVIYSSLSSPHRSVDCQSSTVTYSTVDSVVYSDTRS